jgi:hypothetical protein
MMDLAERYVQRSELLLRLLSPDDLGHLVDPEARIEICRVLKLTEPRNACGLPDVPEPICAINRMLERL